MLLTILQNNNIVVRNSSEDADMLIVQTAVEKFQQVLPTILTHDIDILVNLSALTVSENSVFFL